MRRRLPPADLSHPGPCLLPSLQFERGGPLDINGTAFAAELEEVKQVGGVGYQGVTAFTVETAQFWFNGAGKRGDPAGAADLLACWRCCRPAALAYHTSPTHTLPRPRRHVLFRGPVV